MAGMTNAFPINARFPAVAGVLYKADRGAIFHPRTLFHVFHISWK